MENYSSPKKMKLLGDLFSKYKNHFKAPQATVEKASIEVIKNITNLSLKENQVIYTPSTRTLTLNVPSILKSELKIAYPNILESLKKDLGDKESPLNII